MSNPGGEIMRIQSIAPRDWGLLILRLGLGITLILHGYPKFAGAGPMAFARYLRVHHFPAPPMSGVSPPALPMASLTGSRAFSTGPVTGFTAFSTGSVTGVRALSAESTTGLTAF